MFRLQEWKLLITGLIWPYHRGAGYHQPFDNRIWKMRQSVIDLIKVSLLFHLSHLSPSSNALIHNAVHKELLCCMLLFCFINLWPLSCSHVLTSDPATRGSLKIHAPTLTSQALKRPALAAHQPKTSTPGTALFKTSGSIRLQQLADSFSPSIRHDADSLLTLVSPTLSSPFPPTVLGLSVWNANPVFLWKS